MNDYAVVTADKRLEDDLRAIVRLAVAEDLNGAVDWTTVCLIDEGSRGACEVVSRDAGICAGLVTLPWILDEFRAELAVEMLIADGQPLRPGQPMARIRGHARDLLTSERTLLNVLSRLCGIASLAGRYVERIAGTGARLYDTRKTTPGWRRLEKYAVACGGGHNHRTGLFDGFLIKDNHLALGGETGEPLSPREAAERALRWRAGKRQEPAVPKIVEIEVDSIDQLREVLPAGPDLVLLDNFSLDQLREAVRIRDAENPSVGLEASGNVTLETIGEIAATGVDRISSGALTHQAIWLDLGLDWFATATS